MCQLFLWVVLWLGLTVKRRWTFKLPPLTQQPSGSMDVIHPGKQKILQSVEEPLLPPPHHADPQPPTMVSSGLHQNSLPRSPHTEGGGEEIYWPHSPKMKVTFNEVTSMCPSSSSARDPHHQNYALVAGELGDKR